MPELIQWTEPKEATEWYLKQRGSLLAESLELMAFLSSPILISLLVFGYKYHFSHALRHVWMLVSRIWPIWMLMPFFFIASLIERRSKRQCSLTEKGILLRHPLGHFVRWSRLEYYSFGDNTGLGGVRTLEFDYRGSKRKKLMSFDTKDDDESVIRAIFEQYAPGKYRQ